MDFSRNPLLAAERDGMNRTSRWGSLLVFLLGILFSQLVFGGILSLAGVLTQPEGTMTFKDQAGWTLLFLPQTAVLAAWVRFKEKRPFSGMGLQDPTRGGVRFAVGLFSGVLTMLVLAGIISALGGFVRGAPGPNAHVGVGALGAVLVLLVCFAVQGSSEEIYTRGFLLPIWGNRGRIGVALLAQALAFLSVHLLNGHLSFVPLLNLVLVAIFLGLVALKEGSLWWVCGWHAGWNWCQSNILGIPVSGIQVSNSLVLLQPSAKTPIVVNGGLFGVEGSALTSAYLAAGIVVAFVLIRRADGQRNAP